MSDVTLIGLIIAVAVVLFVWNRLPVVIVAMGDGAVRSGRPAC